MHAPVEYPVRPEKTEAHHVAIQPPMEAVKYAAGRSLFRQQAHTVAFRHCRAVYDVDLAAPMMSAAAGYRAPANDGVHEFGLTETGMVPDAAVGIIERPLAAILHVPDSLLCSEIAKRAHDPDIEALSRSGIPHRDKWLDRLARKRCPEIISLLYVSARPACKLQFVQHAGILNPPGRGRDAVARNKKAGHRAGFLESAYSVCQAAAEAVSFDGCFAPLSAGSGRSINSTYAIGALSPLRKPNLRMRR